MNRNQSTMIAVFETRAQADHAVDELLRAGFHQNQIGVVARESKGDNAWRDSGDTYAEEGAMTGALAGAGVGGLVGLGVISGIVPVIGPAIAAGALGTILLNAAGGAALGSITGALIGQGIPEDEAHFYEDELKAGRYLVTVHADDRREEAWTILQWHGGYGYDNVREDSEWMRHSTFAHH